MLRRLTSNIFATTCVSARHNYYRCLYSNFQRQFRPSIINSTVRGCSRRSTVNDDPINHLITIADFLRYAITQFNKNKLVYGQSTIDAYQEATLMIVCHLNLNIHDNIFEKWGRRRLTYQEKKGLYELMERRISTRLPMAYLLNACYQQGEKFYIDDRVLIPRSYLAEVMFSAALVRLVDPTKVRSLLDLCTGSGCLAILSTICFPNAIDIVATDLCPEATTVARINIEKKGLSSLISLRCGDLFDTVPEKTFDLIISNPPYVDTRAMERLPTEYKTEPRLALYGGDDGMLVVERILATASFHLADGGGLLMEIGRLKRILEKNHRAFSREIQWIETAHSSGECFFASKTIIEKHF